MDLGLGGKRAIVLGVANHRSIAWAIAQALAAEGMQIALTYQERMEESVSGSLADFHALYGLTRERLDRAAPDALVMHPGPMNRGVEIEGSLADDPERSAIREQVEAGVAVRMACLDLLTRERRG